MSRTVLFLVLSMVYGCANECDAPGERSVLCLVETPVVDPPCERVTWFEDADLDGFGAGPLQEGCAIPTDGALVDGDCDDAVGSIFPRATEVPYDGVDQDCDEEDLTDVDGDGFDQGEDCNDADASIHPGAPEIPYDGIDQDCDGTDLTDMDGDGFNQGEDCNDADASIYPGAPEIPYDGVDQDCDGGDLMDVDEDGFGQGEDCNDGDASIYPGAPEVPYDGIDQDCEGGDLTDVDEDGFDQGEDCNDGDASVFPGAPEVPYDGIDQDCDESDLVDVDEDGFDEGEDCDDEDASIYPGAPEVPGDGIDQDCNGEDRVDLDGDGAFNDVDCDDDDASAFPQAFESACSDTVDNDCDGQEDCLDNDCDAGGGVTITDLKNLNTDVVAVCRTYADGIAYRIEAPMMGDSEVLGFDPTDDMTQGLSVGDSVLIVNLKGSSADFADVGTYEVAEVGGLTPDRLMLVQPLAQSYTGTLASRQHVVVQRIPRYTSVEIADGGRLTASAWDSLTEGPSGAAGYATGIVALEVRGRTHIHTGGHLSADGLGFRGGVRGTAPPGFSGCGRNGNRGESFGPATGGGGGGGGNNDGDGSNGGRANHNHGLMELSRMYFGPGGGAGGSSGPCCGGGGTGGRGGGMIHLWSSELIVEGELSAKGIGGFPGGSNGNCGGSNGVEGGAGGAGAGGSIRLRSDDASIGVNAVGTLGGPTTAWNPTPGLPGWTRIDYTCSLDGEMDTPLFTEEGTCMP